MTSMTAYALMKTRLSLIFVVAVFRRRLSLAAIICKGHEASGQWCKLEWLVRSHPSLAKPVAAENGVGGLRVRFAQKVSGVCRVCTGLRTGLRVGS